jgi:hypothetical protein
LPLLALPPSIAAWAKAVISTKTNRVLQKTFKDRRTLFMVYLRGMSLADSPE